MDWETELAKEMLLRDAADAALFTEARLLATALEGLRARLDHMESSLHGFVEEARLRHSIVEEGSEVFQRLGGGGPWIAVREHLVDVRERERTLRVPAWVVTDGKRYWSEPSAVLTTQRPTTPAAQVGLLRRLTIVASRWVSG